MMTQFEHDPLQSREIEARIVKDFKLIKRHFESESRYPFMAANRVRAEYVFSRLFWLYYVVDLIGSNECSKFTHLNPYSLFEGGEENETIPVLDCANSIENKAFYIIQATEDEDKFGFDYFSVKVFLDNRFLHNAEVELLTLGIEVDLRHPEALNKAREFMHAFFIEKLPLEEMEKRVEWFDQHEAYQFKRDSNHV